MWSILVAKFTTGIIFIFHLVIFCDFYSGSENRHMLVPFSETRFIPKKATVLIVGQSYHLEVKVEETWRVQALFAASPLDPPPARFKILGGKILISSPPGPPTARFQTLVSSTISGQEDFYSHLHNRRKCHYLGFKILDSATFSGRLWFLISMLSPLGPLISFKKDIGR